MCFASACWAWVCGPVCTFVGIRRLNPRQRWGSSLIRSFFIVPLVLCGLTACAGHSAIEGLEPLRAPRGVVVDDQVLTYPVTGADRATIHGQLRIPNPAAAESFAGTHESRFAWTYEVRDVRGRCAVRSATVTLTSIVTLPEWTPPPKVDGSLVADWARMRKAIATHEQGHRLIAYEGAARVRRALEKIPKQSCAAMPGAAQAAADLVLHDLDLRQQRYDERTAHGVKQGTTW